MERSMIDVASGGALVDKIPAAARNLIANMAANSQRLGIRMGAATKVVNEVNTSSHANQQRMEHRLDELTSLVRQMAMGQHEPPAQTPAIVCSICSSSSCPTNSCPTLQDDGSAFPDQSVAAA